MYRKIVVAMALDHDISPRTLEVANALREPDAEIIALHVYEQPQGSARSYLDPEVIEEGVARAEKLLHGKTAGVSGVKPVLVQGHTYRTIIDYAAAEGIDCIVIGSHKPGLSDYLLGSTAARVVRNAPCAVHVYRNS